MKMFCALLTMTVMLVMLFTTQASCQNPNQASNPATAQATTQDPMIGQPAPDFTLPANTGGQIGLAQFKGKQPVVLAFYPKDFTAG